MGLEEHTIETAERRCVVCGTPLTEEEIEISLEEEAPSLCTRCSLDLVELDEDESDSGGEAAGGQTPPAAA